MGQGRTDLRVTAVYSSYCAGGLRRIHALYKYSTELVRWRCHSIFHAHHLRQHLLQSLHTPPPPLHHHQTKRGRAYKHMHRDTQPCARPCMLALPHAHTHAHAQDHARTTRTRRHARTQQHTWQTQTHSHAQTSRTVSHAWHHAYVRLCTHAH